MGDDKKPVEQPTPVGSETQPTTSGHATSSNDKPRVTAEKPTTTERK